MELQTTVCCNEQLVENMMAAKKIQLIILNTIMQDILKSYHKVKLHIKGLCACVCVCD